MIGDDDRMVISDWGQGRLTTIDAQFQVVGSQQTALLPSLLLPDGRMVMAEQIYTPDQIGFPIHVISPTGEIERSFGVSRPEYSPNARLATTRLAASGPDGSLWTVPPGRYMLEQWDATTGERLDSFEIDTPEIRPVRKWPADPSVLPPGIIESLWLDGANRIFLLLRVPAPDWHPRDAPLAEEPLTAEEYDATYDWIIQVVDPQHHQLLASTRFPTALWGRPSSAALVTVSLAEKSLEPKYEVWHPILTQGEVLQ
jgi:hypothetical protein